MNTQNIQSEPKVWRGEHTSWFWFKTAVWFFLSSFLLFEVMIPVAITSYIVGLVIILWGITYIQADPPHKALITKFGQLLWKKNAEDNFIPVVKEEGFRWIFLDGIWFGKIVFSVEKKNFDYPPQTIMTPDNGRIKVPKSFTFIPDEENIVNFIKYGKAEGVIETLDEVAAEKLRIFALSKHEGPQNWKDLMAAKEEAVAVILKAIVGDEVWTQIHPEIPTGKLLKYFHKPIPVPPFENEKVEWGENWLRVKEILEKMAPEAQTELKKKVEERASFIEAIRRGNGTQQIPQFGIILNRFNLGEMEPIGELARTIDLKVGEEQERNAEVFETGTELAQATALKDEFAKQGKEVSIEDAYRKIMEWKLTKQGRGFTIPSGVDALEAIAKAITIWTLNQKGGKS